MAGQQTTDMTVDIIIIRKVMEVRWNDLKIEKAHIMRHKYTYTHTHLGLECSGSLLKVSG